MKMLGNIFMWFVLCFFVGGTFLYLLSLIFLLGAPGQIVSNFVK